MAITIWDQFNELERRMDDLFATGLLTPWRRLPDGPAERRFVPTADVFRRGDDLVVRAELPGIDPEKDVKVTLTDGRLTISGERKQTSEVKKEHYYRSESTYGTFERTLPLPEGTDESKIECTYQNGVLQVVVHEGAKPAAPASAKPIEIKIQSREPAAV